MGRRKPERLGVKLKTIRLHFDYSFSQMAERLSDKNVTVLRTDISRYEKGLREPSLIVLLRYAKLVKISTDVLIDDKAEVSVPKDLNN